MRHRRRGLLLVVLGLGVLFSIRLGVSEREASRATRAVSIARSARFGPARIRLEQVLRAEEPQRPLHWSAPNPELWGTTIEVILNVGNARHYPFAVHVEGKKVDPLSPEARELVRRAQEIPRPGSGGKGT